MQEAFPPILLEEPRQPRRAPPPPRADAEGEREPADDSAERRGPTKAAKGLTVTADYFWADTPAIDVLVYPGVGMRSHIDNAAYLDWVRTESSP